MVEDTSDDIEGQSPDTTDQGDDLVDTASDLKNLYDDYSNKPPEQSPENPTSESTAPENSQGESGPAGDQKENKSPSDASDSKDDTDKTTDNIQGGAKSGNGAEDIVEGAGDVGEGAEDVASKAGKGRNVAGYVGGQIGESAGSGTAKALGGDEQQQDIAGDVGDKGGTAGGTALHDKYLGAKGPKTAGEGGETAGAGGETTGTAGAGAGAETGGTGSGAAGGATEGAGVAGGAGTGATGAGAAGEAGAVAGGAEAGAVAGGEAAAGTGAAAGAGAGAAGTAAGAAAGTAAAEGTAAGGGIIAAIGGWPVILALLGLFIIGIIVFFIIMIAIIVSPRLMYKDPGNTADNLASIKELVSSDMIKFANESDDLKKIKNGEIAIQALNTIDNLAKSHEQIFIHYTGVREYAPGLTKANDSFEFDITAIDKIKCTDTTSNTQLIEFPIYLNLNYDWKSLVLPSYSDKIICAVGYYPTINSPISTTYKDLFSPGEFPIQELPERAKMAIQEKTAELIDEIISQDRLLGIDSTSSDSLLPVKMTLDSTMMGQNFKNSTTTGISSALDGRIKQAYKAPYPDKPYNPLETINNYNGLHVSYL